MHRGTPDPAGRRLTKADVELLLTTYDDDPVGALSAALRIVLGRPGAPWEDLIIDERLADRRRSLAAGSVVAFDRLVQDLNELRQLPAAGSPITG